jgi:hypothetical protein
LRKIYEGANEDGDEDGNTAHPQDLHNTAIDAVYKPWVKERLCWDILVSIAVFYPVTDADTARKQLNASISRVRVLSRSWTLR